MKTLTLSLFAASFGLSVMTASSQAPVAPPPPLPIPAPALPAAPGVLPAPSAVPVPVAPAPVQILPGAPGVPAAPHVVRPVAPAAAVPSLSASLIQLRAMRDQNAKLIEQQAATLKQLDEMEKVSQQLKLFGKRS